MKLTIVGAGSVRYALQLVGDLAKTEELSKKGPVVSLMDINEERLKATEILARRYMEELEVPVKIEATTSLEAAVEGADYVINTALAYPRPEGADGFAAYEKVVEISERHGYYRGIDAQEFNFVSTYTYVFCSYYDLTLALNVARTMEKYAPEGWILQTGNPVFEITQLLTRETPVKTVGFCHGHGGVHEVCEQLGLPYEEVDWQVAGVNHGIWLNRLRHRGEDAYPLLDRWIEEKGPSWESRSPWDVQMSPAVMDMYRFYGMLPIGDTCRNGSWKYNYDLATKKRWYGRFGGIDNEVERPKFHEQLREGKRKMLELAAEVAADPSIRLTERWPRLFSRERRSGEQQIPFVQALECGTPQRLVLNMPNRGVIEGIPDDVVVELPARVDGEGLHPERIEPDLTPRIKKMYLWPRILRMEWALEAYLSRDIRVFEEILVRDPRTRSFEQVQAVLRDIWALPFHEELRQNFPMGGTT
ncbi:alpha-glucosidase AglA [Spirochaeta thermophila]|uniref:Putative alpha-glucosidase n=1 Tax=Winmispira thermophila (strain ATCC 49972 / DSM 6192 / RI 19.B1) TaxID=665571 RepID=E0RUB8_WINT6|nr:alpha-glucosidase AglA [Spirochaeta thermophila]ADN02339.1 putative alpha-glucosidase [Spirochaeta thermophila DSM 6192]